MNRDWIIAILLLTTATLFLVIMSLWCRSIIEKMAKRGYRTARETIKDKTK